MRGRPQDPLKLLRNLRSDVANDVDLSFHSAVKKLCERLGNLAPTENWRNTQIEQFIQCRGDSA